MKILLKIAYVGTAYCGYQVQPNGVTVQEALSAVSTSLGHGEKRNALMREYICVPIE